MVGPTEALRGRAGGPGVDVPRGAIPGLLSHERESGWQLAQRVWADSGVDWAAPAQTGSDDDLYAADPYAASQYQPGGDDPASYPDDAYEPGRDESGPYADGTYEPGRDDSGPYADEYGAGPDSVDDDDALAPYDVGRYAAAPVALTVETPGDSRLGAGPWPVQTSRDDMLAERERGGPDAAEREAADTSRVDAEQPAGRRLAPPLPRRIRPRPQWDTPLLAGDAGQAVPEDRSGRVTLPPPAFRAPAPSTPPPSDEPDELFRAWQGSVQAATGRARLSPRARRAGRRPARDGRPADRGRAWQAAKVGVPAVVVVTVGAVALLMLTGRANDMLAVPTGNSGAATPSAAPGGAGPAGILSGYSGEQGSVRVTGIWSAAGTTLAAGYADMHPAVWRRAANGTWTLVSAAVLGGMTGHLTSIAHGAHGWIAVGSAVIGGKAEPAVYASADGLTWTPMPALTALAGPTAQLLGVAAGPGGYLVAGRQGTGKKAFAQFWWSADLKHWTATGNSGYTNSFGAAAVATGGGFVVAGSQGSCHTIWTSPDGRHWTTHDIAKPPGAHLATLRYAATGPGGKVVAAGFAANQAGYLPIVVTSADHGQRIGQVVLPTAGKPGLVTAVTATTTGFVAVGQVGSGRNQQTVTWTSPDGATWSAATPVTAAASAQITAVARVGSTVTGTEQQGPGATIVTVRIR